MQTKVEQRSRKWFVGCSQFVPFPSEELRIHSLRGDLREVVHFSVHGCLADFQVLLRADAGKERRSRSSRRAPSVSSRGLLGFDISRDQIFEKSAAVGNGFLRRGWELTTKLGPCSLEGNRPRNSPFDITTPAWRSKPSRMLAAGADRTINPDLERWYATRANSHKVELPGTSHSV
jgi:hypothetical protein